MKINAVLTRLRLTQVLIALACALGVLTAVSAPAYAATVPFSAGSYHGDVWGNVSRVNSHKVKIDANLYNDTGVSLSWQACWGYTEYGAFYQAGCNSLRYNNAAGTTKTWTGLTYNDPNAAIAWVYIRLFVNGSEVSNSGFLWP
jgi:hypothetical protein